VPPKWSPDVITHHWYTACCWVQYFGVDMHYSWVHSLNNVEKWVLKNHLIVDGGGECDYSIMSCASASPAPQRWYMMHWVESMHQDAGRKDHIISHQHHFVLLCKLLNQSYPRHKVVQISKNRRYHNFPTARELFYIVPTCSIPNGST